jgi:cellulose synthase/poly-beta-1,6-N-acetylglucosamine synthase-like glycosyltransferase
MALVYLFHFLILIYSFFYLGVILLLMRSRSRLRKYTSTEKPFYSVVVAARNEEKFLDRCIKSLQAQTYGKEHYEIIIVNDRSTDKTKQIVEKFKKSDERVRLINITECPENTSPKKHALSRGVEQARGEIIITTDADSVAPPTWITSMNHYFDKDTSMVLGFVVLHHNPSMGEKLWGVQALELFGFSTVSALTTGLGFPISANSNNLAYRRDVFEKIKGYEGVKNVVSGDDELLLNRVLKIPKSKVRFAGEKGAIISTEPAHSYAGLWEQRKRWASKCVFYDSKRKFFLANVFIYYALISLQVLMCLLFQGLVFSTVTAIIIKFLCDYLLLSQSMEVFNHRELEKNFIFAEIIHIPLTVAAVLFGTYGPFSWKDGKVRKTVGSK